MIDAEGRRRRRALLASVRRDRVFVDGHEVPGSVAQLLHELSSVVDPWARFDIWRDIREEFARVEDWTRQLDATRKAAAELPDEPLPQAVLAECLVANDNLTEAKEVIEGAVKCAEAKGRFLRYCLGARARLARRSLDAELFADSLRRLISCGRLSEAGEDDVDLESDIIASDVSEFDEDSEIRNLVHAFRELIQSRST